MHDIIKLIVHFQPELDEPAVLRYLARDDSTEMVAYFTRTWMALAACSDAMLFLATLEAA